MLLRSSLCGCFQVKDSHISCIFLIRVMSIFLYFFCVFSDESHSQTNFEGAYYHPLSQCVVYCMKVRMCTGNVWSILRPNIEKQLYLTESDSLITLFTVSGNGQLSESFLKPSLDDWICLKGVLSLSYDKENPICIHRVLQTENTGLCLAKDKKCRLIWTYLFLRVYSVTLGSIHTGPGLVYCW